MRTLLLDPNSLLEFLLNRSNFIGKVEYLSTIFRHNSGIQLYLSQPGLDKIVSLIKPLNGLRKTEQLVTKLKKRIKILRPTKAVAEQAKSSPINYDSAVEVYLAIKKNIDAIATHQPEKFSSEKLSIITLSDLQLNHLELSLAKNINELPAILVTPIDKILNLNRALHLHSHIAVKSLKLNKYTRQLDPTYSSGKVSSLSGDNSSPRSLKQIIADSLSNRSAFGRSTASTDVLQYNSLATAHLAHEKHLDDLRTSMSRAIQRQSDDFSAVGLAHEKHWDNLKEIAIQNSRVCSLFSDRLPLQKVEFSAIETIAHSSVIDRLVVSDNLRKLSNLSVEHLTLKSSLNELNNAIASIGNVQSSLVDSPSIKPQLAQSIAKLEAARFSGGAIERLTCKSSLDPWQERIARSGQANSFLKVDASLSDRAGLLSQFKLLESMQKANILESYLSRQN